MLARVLTPSSPVREKERREMMNMVIEYILLFLTMVALQIK
jgi:hypothetical protein